MKSKNPDKEMAELYYNLYLGCLHIFSFKTPILFIVGIKYFTCLDLL